VLPAISRSTAPIKAQASVPPLRKNLTTPIPLLEVVVSARTA
jgi:hypothetical protein